MIGGNSLIASSTGSIYAYIFNNDVAAIAATDTSSCCTGTFIISRYGAALGCQLIICSVLAFNGECSTIAYIDGSSSSGSNTVLRAGHDNRRTAALDIDTDAVSTDNRILQLYGGIAVDCDGICGGNAIRGNDIIAVASNVDVLIG